MIIIGIPTLNRYDLLKKCVNSIYLGNINPDRLIIVDNGGALDFNEFSMYENVSIFKPGNNYGVARSWNWLIQQTKLQHPILITNDDVEFSENDIQKFYSGYENGNDFIYTENTSPLNMYSCFLISPNIIKKVGWFDENFYPAYYEDNDYAYRMKLAGIEFNSVATNISHVGSATIKSFSEAEISMHHNQFRNNTVYYTRKWGGLPGKEVYITPFGDLDEV